METPETMDLEVKNEEGETSSITLTKDDYERIVNESVIAKEETQVTLVKDNESAMKAWDNILTEMKRTNVPIGSDVYKNTSKWKKRGSQFVAILAGKDSENIEVISLLSQKTDKTEMYVNLILTMAPVMTQPFVKMLLATLKKIARDEYNTDLVIPKRYSTYLGEIKESKSLPNLRSKVKDI